MQGNQQSLESPAKICRRVMEKMKGNPWLSARWGVDGLQTRVKMDSDGFWGVVVTFANGQSQHVPFSQLFNVPWTMDASSSVIRDLVALHGPQSEGVEELDQSRRRQVLNGVAEMKREDDAQAMARPGVQKVQPIQFWELNFNRPLQLYVDTNGRLRIHLFLNNLASFTLHSFLLLSESWILVGDGCDKCTDLLLVECIKWRRDPSTNSYECKVHFRWSMDPSKNRVCSLEANGKSHF